MSDDELDADTVAWIAAQLEQATFVTWDRYVVAERDGHTLVDVYGWIDRDDAYKDFVWSRFYPEHETFEYTTSSDTYSERLGELWFGETTDHAPCQRVEATFDIPNRVELND